MPTPVAANGQPFVIVPQLTRIAMAVMSDEFIADLVCPMVPVPGELFQYTKVSTKDLFQMPDDIIGRTGAANQVEFSTSDETDRTVDRGLEVPMPEKDRETAAAANMADPLGWQTEATTKILLRKHEIRVAGLLFGAGNYASGYKLTLDGTSGKHYFSDATNGDPIKYIEDAIEGMVIKPNTLTLGEAVWNAIRRHPKTISRLYGSASTRGSARREDVAAELGLSTIAVGTGWKDSAAKGQATSMAKIWGNYAALTRVQTGLQSAQTVEPVFAFTAQWGTREVGQYFDPRRGKKGVTVTKVVWSTKELMAWQNAGYLFSDCVST
jgi:hypothetical protein